MESQLSRTRGNRLTKDAQQQLILDMVSKLSQSYFTNNELAELLKVDNKTIIRYREFAEELIGANSLDRNIVRNLMINRAFTNLENLTKLLNETGRTFKEKMSVYSQMSKINQHLALITGLNIETKVNVDAKKLVITRAHPDAVKQAMEGEIVPKQS